MNDVQRQAFMAGSGVESAAMQLAIKSSLIVLICIWTTWVAIGAFRAWRFGDLEIYDLLWQVMRASIILLVVGFYIQ
ncbi:MAG: TIGR03758 family integrating conjugative element protein [Gammaproteobacteria bacterium]|nr:TIGR03758 family integrating conjugative element protein [Gammaproteobacteria bacterium]MYC26031.1 TIGR03758 family integrating conjugative element protein [Gammaproteobacteria bacterium]